VTPDFSASALSVINLGGPCSPACKLRLHGAWSAIRPETTEVLIVVEAMHDTAARDVTEMVDTLVADLAALWGSRAQHSMLNERRASVRLGR